MSYSQSLEIKYEIEFLMENEKKNAKKIAKLQQLLANSGY